MKRSQVAGSLFLALTMLTAVGCSSGGNAGGSGSSGGKVIKIGVVAPLTGNSAALGEDFVNGAKLAAAVYNNKEGKLLGQTVEIVAQDDQGDPKQATIVAQKLVDMKVSGIAGHFSSSTTIPAMGIYAKANIPEITPATSAEVVAQGIKGIFRMNFDDTFQGGAMAKYAALQLHLKKFAVIHDKQAFGQGVAQEFQKAATKAGATFTSFNGITPGDVEFKSLLTKIKGEAPDAIYFGGSFQEGGLLIKQARDLGITAKILAPDLVHNGEFFKTAGAAAAGTIVTFPSPPRAQVPELQKFDADYKQQYKKDTILGEYGYDAVLPILQAIEQAKTTDGAKVIETLHKGTFSGLLTKSYQWDQVGSRVGTGGFPIYQATADNWNFLGAF